MALLLLRNTKGVVGERVKTHRNSFGHAEDEKIIKLD